MIEGLLLGASDGYDVGLPRDDGILVGNLDGLLEEGYTEGG